MKRYDRGFTIVELIAVITILGLLLLVAIPEMVASTDHWILESTAREMVQDIRLAQHLAITRGIRYRFDLNLMEKSYLIRSDDSLEKPVKKVDLNNRVDSISSTLASSVHGGDFSHHRILSYSPTGNPSQTGSVVLKTREGKEVTITVAVGTGRAMIKR